MTQDSPTEGPTLDFPETLDREGWLNLLAQMGDEAGYFETLGNHHWASFNDDGSTLLVSFETLEEIRRKQPGEMPFSFGLATRNGWSHLSVICEGKSWYRNDRVFAYFDRLVDDAFFENFDKVVFQGAGMGAYAACAFSVAAPGSTVVAIQPRATLDPAVAIWDRRDIANRALDFNSRYGYAPDMTDGAKQVFVIFDPMQDEDAMHAALFRRPHVHPLRARFIGADVASSLLGMEILGKLVHAAMEDRLTEGLFYRLLRARRDNIQYLRSMLRHCIAKDQPWREAMICQSVSRRLRAPGFRRHLAKLQKDGAVDLD